MKIFEMQYKSSLKLSFWKKLLFFKQIKKYKYSPPCYYIKISCRSTENITLLILLRLLRKQNKKSQ